ncbi:MAG: UvrD-helicase domain-containing protein [Candidatus Promineofilum sp.]|nr:UvrD-helicase domain-containing protein [Promineifilum sp.]
MDLLATLNPAQRDAVSTPPGAVLVVAGPGSGKTRVLTYRIAYLITEMGISPWQIMAVTFTNKAAREMEHRIEQLLGGRPQGLNMGTFHAICARLLRRETDNLTHYQRDFVIFDTADQLQVVKQALSELNIDDKKFPPGKLLNGISSAKNDLIMPHEYQATNYAGEVTRRIYERYQMTLQVNNAMDFDDLLMNVVLLFDEQPATLAKYQERYRHILVDEFQDTNATQYRLLQQLAGQRNSLFAVGDSDQSIYRWRGADYRNIQNFYRDYPESRTVVLEQNYRSTQIILDAAVEVVRRNRDHIPKKLFTERPSGAKIVLREAYNESDEAATVVNTIESLMLEGYNGNAFAVMYRTNAQSRALEEAFVQAGLPYRLVGATQFYQRREVKDIIAYLRVVHNPLDAVSFNRVLNVPTRGIGQQTQAQFMAWAANLGLQPAEALLWLVTDSDAQHPFNGRAYSALATFGNLLSGWMSLRDRVSVGELLDAILERINYRVYLDDGTEEGQDRWANVMELRGVAALNGPGVDSQMNLGDFLQQVSLVAETDNLDAEAQAATLLTLHAAKGLEFPIVFITGLEEGLLPHSRSMDSEDELAEERRLFYVGLTRARDALYLSHAFRRTSWGDSSVAVPSRFLLDIPEELVDGRRPGNRRRESIDRASMWDPGKVSWNDSARTRPSGAGRDNKERRAPSAPAVLVPGAKRLPTPNDHVDDPRPTRPATAQFKTGQKVRHSKFGEGTVIESKVTGGDEEVTVAFPGTGIKRLAASIAGLEAIG